VSQKPIPKPASLLSGRRLCTSPHKRKKDAYPKFAPTSVEFGGVAKERVCCYKKWPSMTRMLRTRERIEILIANRHVICTFALPAFPLELTG
jgi:hypothetical protein